MSSADLPLCRIPHDGEVGMVGSKDRRAASHAKTRTLYEEIGGAALAWSSTGSSRSGTGR
jgi:hypothetical protein